MTALRLEDTRGQAMEGSLLGPWQLPVEATIVMLGLHGNIERADYYARECGDVRDRSIVIDCSRLRFVNRVFCERFLARVLVEGGAAEVELLGPRLEVRVEMQAAATALGVADRLRIGSVGRMLSV